MSEVSGMLSHITTAVANINKEAEARFLGKLIPFEYPLRDIAMNNGLFMPITDVGKKTMQWFEGATGATRVNLNSAVSSNSATTFDFGTTTIQSIVPNQVIAFKDEHVIVVSVDTAAGTAEVVRGFAETTPEASILTTDVGKVTSTAGPAGDAAGRSRATLGASYTNYLQRWEQVYSCDDLIQGTIASYKTPELSIEYQIMDKFDMIAAELANSLWESRATAATHANRTMNGLRAQIPSGNITSNVGALYFSSIDTPVGASAALAGRLDTMAVSAAMRIKLAVWNGRRSGAIVISDLTSAGGALGSFTTASGQELRVITDSTLRDDEIFLFQAEHLGAGLLPVLPPKDGAPGITAPTGIRVELMARSGDADTVQVLAYGSCQLRRPGLARLLTGVTSVIADGVTVPSG